MNNYNVLVTGSAGFIGSNFVNHMTSAYPSCKFYTIDKLDYCANVDNIKPKFNHKFYKCDLNDKNFVDFILQSNNINYVIHFAAQSHVDNSFDNSLQYTEDNIKGTHTLLDCCKRYGKIKLFIHMSTDEVYGETKYHTAVEYSILNPTNAYAATKAAAEMLIRSYYHSFKFPIIIVRANNIYGPNQYPEKLIPKFIKYIHENKNLPIHGSGYNKRHFLHVNDLISAIELILTQGKIGEVYNVGSDDEYSVLEIATMILKILKPDSNIDDWIEYVDDRPFNDMRYVIDSSKIKELGWQAKMQFYPCLASLCME